MILNVFISFGSALMLLLKYIILPIISIAILLILINIVYQYIKYGKSVFSSFKMKNTKDARDQILYLTLEKLDVIKRIIKLPYLNSNYVLITSSGIYLIYLFLEEGIIQGNEDDDHLLLSLGSVQNRPIMNPFLKIKEDEEKVKKLLPDVRVSKYLVTLSNEYIEVKTDTEIMKYNDILFKLPVDSIYTEQEIITFSNTLRKNVK